MKKIALFLSILFIATLFSCEETSAQESKLLEPNELIEVLSSKDAHFIDVRTPQEFSAGHIENAVNIDFKSSNFETEIEKLDSKKPIIIYCRSGRRSAASTNTLSKAGFTEIYDLKGGVLNWKKQGNKLVTE